MLKKVMADLEDIPNLTDSSGDDGSDDQLDDENEKGKRQNRSNVKVFVKGNEDSDSCVDSDDDNGSTEEKGGDIFSFFKHLAFRSRSNVESTGNASGGEKNVIKYKGAESIKQAVRKGKILQINGKDSSDENDEGPVDDKTNLRRAEKLLRRKNFTEAKDIYSELLSTNSVDDKYWSHNFDNYRIVMCSMNKAKCHLRLGEYSEAISTIDRCISHEDVMKEGSKFNKVHLYQRLAAAYLMRMEYRACLLVCIYGLTQFNNDEKLLSIQKHINTSYPPTVDAVMCWLDDKSSFVLDGDKQESSLCNKTLIKMCIKVQKYDSESDSNEKYMQQLSSVIRELETEQKIETNGVKAKPTENETVSGSDGTSWDTGKDPKYRKFCEENVIILKAAEKACDLFQNKRYAEAVVEFESALKVPTREPDLSMIQYSISRSCYFTDTYENLLKGLQILEKQRSDYVEILTMFEGRGNDPFNSGILELARSTVPAIFYALSQHLYRFKQYDEALKVLKEANKHLKTAKAPTKFRDSSTKVWKKVTTAFPELLPNEAAKRKIDELFNTLKNLPKPDAACFHPECININQHEHIAPKKEIYFNKDIKDVDFKGMAILKCEDKCVIAYHATCWKEHKRTMEKIKYDKDFLGKKCYTPDCGGKVIELRLVRETGKESIVKAEEEVKKVEDVKKSKAKAVSSTAAPTDTLENEKQVKKNAAKDKNTEGKANKKEKKSNDARAPDLQATSHNTAASETVNNSEEKTKFEDMDKDQQVKKLMEELALARKKIEEHERQIERNLGEMHDVLVRNDESKNHVKRQAEEIKKLKLSMEKEKANLEEEKSYNLRLLELNETKENEVLQIKERHAKEIYEFALYEGAKYQRLAEFLNTKILTQSTTIGRVVWDYDEYLGKIRSNPAFISSVPSAKTFPIKGPDEPDFKSLMNEYQSHIEHELKKTNHLSPSPGLPKEAAGATSMAFGLPPSPTKTDPLSLSMADFSKPPPNILPFPSMPTPQVNTVNSGVMPKGSDTQEKIKQIISRIKDVYPNMKDDAAFDYIYRTKQHMKQQGRKAKFPADAISFIMQEEEASRARPEQECSICLDDMFNTDTITLECAHRFHKKCINDWFREKHDCPQCRTHALPPDDFPSLLSGR